MIIKDNKDYIKVEDLNKNIHTQIRNLCSDNYFNINCVDDLPFFSFHINFKKNILELLLKDMIKKGKVKQVDIDKLLSIFNSNKISKIEDVSLTNFKLGKMKNHTKFDMQLFVTYTNKIIKLLEKTIYKRVVNALCAVTNTMGDKIEVLGKDFENLEDILDDEPETFFWNELKSISLKDGEAFYRLNSEVEKSFYYSKGILLYPKDEHENNNKRIDKNIFLSSFEGKESIAEKELRGYYDNLYSLLINNIAPIDSSIVIETLSNTFRMLLKKQFGSAVDDAMLEKSKTENEALNLTGLGDYLGVHTGTFGERLNNMYLSKIPDIEELYKISYILDKTSDSLLGLELKEPNFNFSKSEVQQYIMDKYGLNYDTLKVLEALQDYFNGGGNSNSREILNKGLNVLLSSKYVLITPIYKDNSQFINISTIQMFKLQNIYERGIELKENTDIEVSIAVGHYEKKLDNLIVRYNKKGTTIIEKEEDVRIVRTKIKEEYHFDNIVVSKEKLNNKDGVYRITKGKISNIAFLRGKQSSFLDIDINGYRNLVIGREETDFLTPLLRYLGSNNTTFLTINQKDLDTIHEGFEDGEDTVNDFYEEVSTNYGSLRFESDNLQLLEIMTRLKNFKYDK